MQLNNPIFINQTDADGRYVNATGDAINSLQIPFVSEPQTFGNNFVGIYNGNGQIVFSAGSTRVAAIGSYSTLGGIGIAPGRSLFFGTSDRLAGGNFVGDILLTRDSAGILNQASTTTPQQYRIFNITGTNTGEFGLIGWQNNQFIVGSRATNSGLLRDTVVSGSNVFINATGQIDLNNSKLVNSVPEFITETANFLISGNDNGRVILARSATDLTGTIVSGNVTGFNASIIQIGAGSIFITGSGINASIPILSYNNQYKTAGLGATVSILHTGNNGYIMYGNTSL